MIITAWGIPVEQYGLAKEAGINTVWSGEPEACEEHGLTCVLPMPINPFAELPYTELGHSAAIGFTTDDDVPVIGLSIIEAVIQRLRDIRPDAAYPVLVSATYTRLLEHLGAESIEEYYQKFAELAPSATPMLCHYPFRIFWEDGLPTPGRADLVYLHNLSVMEQTFGNKWWAWVQVTAHEYYDGEWQFYELTPRCIEWQVELLMAHGCSGIGYFTFAPFGDADGIMGTDGKPSRYFETVQAINKQIAGQ